MVINLYGKAKTSEMVTVVCGIKNIHFLAPRFLVLLLVESHQRFLELVQQSVFGQPAKIYAIISDVSDQQSIFYTSACIESARIEQYHPDKELNYNCSSRTWNEEDDVFDNQLDNGVPEKYFQIIQNLSKDS